MKPLNEEDLRQLGEQVAHRFLDDGIDLNEGVKLAAVEGGLTHQQVARVCERANKAVFSQAFAQRSRDLIDFPVAHPEKVAHLLADEPSPPPFFDPGSDDYHAPPPPHLQSRAAVTKTAAPAPRRQPQGGLDAQRVLEKRVQVHEKQCEMDKLAEASRQIRADIAGSDIKRQSKEEQLYQYLKQRLLEGDTIKDIHKDLFVDPERTDGRLQSDRGWRRIMDRIGGRLKAENLIDAHAPLPGRAPAPVQTQTSQQTATPQDKQASWALSEALQHDAEAEVLHQALSTIEEDLTYIERTL